MLSGWQVFLLDHGLWLVPGLTVFALICFPWKHWNSLIR